MGEWLMTQLPLLVVVAAIIGMWGTFVWMIHPPNPNPQHRTRTWWRGLVVGWRGIREGFFGVLTGLAMTVVGPLRGIRAEFGRGPGEWPVVEWLRHDFGCRCSECQRAWIPVREPEALEQARCELKASERWQERRDRERELRVRQLSEQWQEKAGRRV